MKSKHPTAAELRNSRVDCEPDTDMDDIMNRITSLSRAGEISAIFTGLSNNNKRYLRRLGYIVQQLDLCVGVSWGE